MPVPEAGSEIGPATRCDRECREDSYRADGGEEMDYLTKTTIDYFKKYADCPGFGASDMISKRLTAFTKRTASMIDRYGPAWRSSNLFFEDDNTKSLAILGEVIASVSKNNAPMYAADDEFAVEINATIEAMSDMACQDTTQILAYEMDGEVPLIYGVVRFKHGQIQLDPGSWLMAVVFAKKECRDERCTCGEAIDVATISFPEKWIDGGHTRILVRDNKLVFDVLSKAGGVFREAVVATSIVSILFGHLLNPESVETSTDSRGSQNGGFGAKARLKMRQIPKYHKASEKVHKGGTHRSPDPHIRSGHWRNQPYGKGLSLTKRIWIDPVSVGSQDAG